MKVTEVGNYVEFLPVTIKEIQILQKFPGFIKTYSRFLCPKKGPVVRNLYERLVRYPAIKWEIDPSCEKYFQKGRLEEIPPYFPFKTKPLDHQIIALRFLYTNKGGGLLLDPGLGKTKVALDYILLERFNKVVVICPKPLTFVWEEEIQVHRPELSFHIFESTNWEEEFPKAKDKNVWILTYRKASLLAERLAKQKFEAMFVDEALVKDPTSDQTQAITALSKAIPVKVLMSGTLVNNSEADMFAPVRIMEEALVGYNYTAFRDSYLITYKPYEKSTDLKKQLITIVTGCKEPEICKSILNSCAIVMRKEKWLKDLPGKIFHNINVAATEEIKRHYYEFLSNYVTKIDGEFIEVDNPLAALAKLAQFSSGFVYKSDSCGDDLFLEKPRGKGRKGKRAVEDIYFFSTNPKISALKDLLDGELKNRKFLLWYCMDAESILIENLLKELGIKFEMIKGGDKKIKQKIKAFNTDDTLQVLACQAKTLNYGVTTLGKQCEEDAEDILLLNRLNPAVFTQVFFSVTYSLEVFLQQQDRIHRIGQTNECHYYMLVSDLPTEQKLIQALKDKQEIREFMLEDIIHRSRHELV